MPALQGISDCRVRLERECGRLPALDFVASSALAPIREVLELSAMRVGVTVAAPGFGRQLQIDRQDHSSRALLVALLAAHIDMLAGQGKARSIVVESYLGGAQETAGDVAARTGRAGPALVHVTVAITALVMGPLENESRCRL